MNLDELLKNRLDQLGGSHRQLKANRESGSRTILNEQGQECINFSSNDYLGLSLNEVNSQNLKAQPSSRLLSGNLQEHLEYESLLSDWLEYEKGLIFPTGYMANMGLLSTIVRKDDVLLMDRYCHASLMDGAQLSRAKIERYRHLDLNHLQTLLEKQEKGKVCWVITESLFSMDGDVPEFKTLQELKNKYGFYLVVDEAHAMGVFGEEGRGLTAEYSGLVDILTFTLSKSFAMQGGVVVGSNQLIDLLKARCRPLIYTTATPISFWSFLPERLKAIKNGNEQRIHLLNLCQVLEEKIGLNRGCTTPIIPYQIGDDKQCRELAQKLEKQGIFCPAILPPTVPPGTSRLRFSLTAAHKEEDLEVLINFLRENKVFEKP